MKEIRLEWRQRYALNGMLLYLVATIFVCYLSFKLKVRDLDPITWNTLFWIILLFMATNGVAKSFLQERQGRLLYYYMLANPTDIILSKMIYNSALLLVLGLLGFGIYAGLMGNPVQNVAMYIVTLMLGSLGFAGTLTMVAGIASKAENSPTLMAVLSFPIILPMLLMLLKMAKNAMDGLTWSDNADEIMTILAINAIVWVLSVVLFPYLWRS